LSKREQADKVLTEQIQSVFTNSAATYGSPCVYAELRAQGVECSRHRVARLMRQAGLSVAQMRRRINPTRHCTH
jgi:transposase InsO family protein